MSITSSGILFVVGTPIGNLDDITLRALRVLGSVPIIAAEDTRAAQHLLMRHGLWPRPAGELQLVSFFTGNEAGRTAALLDDLSRGQNVALISEAGMPAISDPGQRLVQAAVAQGIKVEVVPGPSAALTALCGSGLPTDRFLFLGFPPRQEGHRQELFGSLRGDPSTLVLYESKERTAATLGDLARALGGERPGCVARELTKLHEEYVRAPLSELAARYAEAPPRGEVTIIVAGATGPAPDALDLKDLEAEVQRRLRAGQGAREIAAALALLTGKPRRQIYQVALALRHDQDCED